MSQRQSASQATIDFPHPAPLGASPSLEDPRVLKAVQEYLAALEAGKPPDREKFLALHFEIAETLAGCLAALEFVHVVAPQLGPSGSGPSDGTSPSVSLVQPGVPLGDFRILREIGRGGMGVVYEAEQMSLGRRVALKVLPFASTLDTKQLQRFKNESQAAAGLHHTNIVPIHATGCERGVHFYAMQFVEGQTLAALIQELRQLEGREARESRIEDRGSNALGAGHALGAGLPIPPKGPTKGLLQPTGPYAKDDHEAAQSSDQASDQREANTTIEEQACGSETLPAQPRSSILNSRSPGFFRTVANLGIQAAEALEHAHQLGVIHRDIKPANLMVENCPLPTAHCPLRLWITDFGLAHCQNQAGLTMTGDLMGTLRYMSPEQALAKRVIVDHRTDIYSLGVTLYELLTLEPAYPETDRQELLRRIAFEDPQPPRRLNKRIPAELETIVLKAMEKSPDDRYASAQELAADLERFLKDEPIRARRASLIKRTKKWMRRHRPAVIAFVSVALIGLLAIITFLFERYRRLDDISRSVHDSLTSAKTALESRDLSLARQKLAEAEGRLANDWKSLANLAEELQELHDKLEAYTRAEESFQKFMKLTSKAATSFTGPTTDSIGLFQEAFSLYGVMDQTHGSSALGDDLLTSEQVSQLRKTIYQNLLVLADHEVRWWGTDASGQLGWTGEPRPGQNVSQEANARQSMVYLKKAAEYHEPTRAYYWVRSKCWKILGDGKAAEADTESVKHTEAVLGVDYFLSARDAGWARNYKEAIKQLQMGLLVEPTHDWSLEFLAKYLMEESRNDEASLALKGLQAVNPGYLDSYDYQLEILRQQKRFEEAVALATKAIEQEPNRHSFYDRRGQAYQEMGKFTDALADFNKVLELDPEDKCKLHYSRRGNFYLQREQYDLALTDFNKALELRPNDAAYDDRGKAYQGLGKLAEALADYNKAIELDPEDKNYGVHYHNRGCCHLEREEYELALADLNRALQLKPEADSYNRRGQVYYGQDRFDLAMADFNKAIELKPEEPDLYLNRSDVYCARAEYDKALKDCDKAIELRPMASNGHVGRGFAYKGLHRYGEMMLDFNQALELNPKDLRLAGGLAYQLTNGPSQVRNAERALPLAEKALQAYPADVWCVSTIGIVYYRLGRFQEAVERFEEALKCGKKSATARCLLFLAMSYHQLGQADKASEHYQKALTWMKEHPIKDKQRSEDLEKTRYEAEQLLNEN